MSKHIHAEPMLQYAQDAMETDKPWERWECSKSGRLCSNLYKHPNWLDDYIYRRKPQTVTINGFEMPAPLKEIEAEYYFLESLDSPDYYQVPKSGDKFLDNHRLSRGVVHGSAACAIASCKARLGIDPNGDSDVKEE